MPFHLIAETNIANSQNDLNKLVYLRRSLEIQGKKGEAWNLISNIFHKRSVPKWNSDVDGTQRDMTPKEIKTGTSEIQEKNPTFNYTMNINNVIGRCKDEKCMILQ